MNVQSKKPYIISTASVIVVNAICFFLLRDVLEYKAVALIQLMHISILAMLFSIYPVFVATCINALIWNFFFIPPIFTFHIGKTEDVLLFILYFVIALVHAVLSHKIKKAEKQVRDKEEKEQAIKLYNTLLNSLSHELKTPISTIVGAVDVLQDQHHKLSNHQQKELLNQIDLAGTRLHKQVENLLGMSRLETGLIKLNVQWCDVNELIHSLVFKLQKTTHKTLTYIENEELPFCKLDSGLIEQALQNIIHNAIIYTPNKAEVTIETKLIEQQLAITIADNGQGFADEYLDVIFDKFYRLSHTKPGGTGLGLSIAKGFVQAHHGSIMAKKNIPHGLVIEITLPVETSYINHLKNE